MSSQKRGFTIVELLVVMSIIIILMSILAPATNMLRRYAKNTSQQVQFTDIRKGLEMFEIDFGYFPDSSAMDDDTPAVSYCGAMKLAEAMLGQDGHGFNPKSRFNANGRATVNGVLTDLYLPFIPTGQVLTPIQRDNLASRTKYLENNSIKSYKIADYFPNIAPFNSNAAVISDVFKNLNPTNVAIAGTRVGMPILYYRPQKGNLSHDMADPTNLDNIYNFFDNQELVDIPNPSSSIFHPLGLPVLDPPLPQVGSKFYLDTLDKNANMDLPYNKDTYILISAGNDGLFGTRDDVYNFQK